MTTDIDKELAKRVVKDAAKIVAAEHKAGGAELTGDAKAMNDALNEIVSKQLSMKIQIFRIDPFNPAADPRYVSQIDNLNAQLLIEQGLHPTIKAWCGGGKYRIKVTADGVTARERTIDIEGDPLLPMPERNKGGLPANALMPTGTPGQYTAGPGFAAMLGFQNPAPAPTDSAATKAMSTMEGITSILLAKALGGQDERRTTQESEELTKTRELVAELRREKDLAIANAAHQKEMAELNAKLEKLATAQTQPRAESLLDKVLAVAIVALPEMIKSKTASDQAQMTILTTLITSGQKSDPNQAAILQALLAKPSEHDQMLKMYEAMGSMMGTSVQLTQGIINQMASLQGGDRPWWQDLLMNLAGTVGDVAQTVMGKGPAGETIDVETEETDDKPDLEKAATAAAAAARAKLSAPAEQPQLAGYVGPSRKDKMFMRDSFVKIFELIEDGKSSPHEIAFRVWKHASSGDTAALAWVRDPEGHTAQILLSFVQRAEMAISEERYDSIVAAMVDMSDHFRHGGTAEGYIAHYGIKVSLPKKIHVVPIQTATKEELEEEEAEEEEEEEEEDEETPPAVEAPETQPEVVPTPGLDRVPPPPREDTSVKPTPGLDRVPPPPREDASEKPTPGPDRVPPPPRSEIADPSGASPSAIPAAAKS